MSKRKTLFEIVRLIFFLVFSYSVFAERFIEFSAMDGNNDVSNLIFCEELSDGFCRSLWSAENQGNFQFSDGTQIFYGERRKNVIDYAKFIYIQKLVKNRCNLQLWYYLKSQNVNNLKLI